MSAKADVVRLRGAEALPPPLARTVCIRCGHVGVTVVALDEVAGRSRQQCWCTTLCATQDGWPWLTGEREPKRRKAHA